MGEGTIRSGKQEALVEATMLPDLAISRPRRGVLPGCATRELVCFRASADELLPIRLAGAQGAS